MTPPVLAELPDLNNLFALLLGGSAFSGIALLIRAVMRGGHSGVKSLEEVVVIHERIIKRQQSEAEDADKREDRLRRERDRMRRERDDARAVARAYRLRHGDLTDPNLRRVDIGNGHDDTGRIPPVP